MTAHNPYDSYKKTQVETANQGRLIVMLYDGAIKFTKAGIDAIKAKKVEQAHKNIIRAEDIITELLLCLDYEKGGDIAKKLASIYIYVNQQLLEANITKKIEPLELVIRLMSDLKDSWEKISNKMTDTDSKDMNKKGGLNIAG
jgi:flagellar secretion chaperone FliS